MHVTWKVILCLTWGKTTGLNTSGYVIFGCLLVGLNTSGYVVIGCLIVILQLCSQDLSDLTKENKEKVKDLVLKATEKISSMQKMLFQPSGACNDDAKMLVGQFCVISKDLMERLAVLKTKKGKK